MGCGTSHVRSHVDGSAPGRPVQTGLLRTTKRKLPARMRQHASLTKSADFASPDGCETPASNRSRIRKLSFAPLGQLLSGSLFFCAVAAASQKRFLLLEPFRMRLLQSPLWQKRFSRRKASSTDLGNRTDKVIASLLAAVAFIVRLVPAHREHAKSSAK